MAQNQLFMLEFVVQELIITIGNECAPPEYPLNAEFAFRTGVYVSIPEDDFGMVKDESELASMLCPPPKLKVNENKDKSGQCCLFALGKLVGGNENLMIHVYKKRTEKCKFLIGATEYKMKEMFDKVMEKFEAQNSEKTNNKTNNGDKKNGRRRSGGQELTETAGVDENGAHQANPSIETARNEADEAATGGGVSTELVPEVTNGPRKSSATLSNRSNGKAASDSSVSSYKIREKPIIPPKRDVTVSEVRKMGMPLYNLEGKVTGSMVLLIRLSCMGKTVCTSIPYPEQQRIGGPRPVCDPTCRPLGSMVCANTCMAKIQPCAMLGEDACPEFSISKKSSDSSTLCSNVCESEESLPTIKPRVDTAAYDEFEADLNGCGLAIRVLKNSHKVSAVKRYEDPACCDICKTGGNGDQKTAVTRLLQLVCRVLMSLNSKQGKSTPCQSMNNASNKAPNLQQICQCIQKMLGSGEQTNDCKHPCNQGVSVNRNGQRNSKNSRRKADMAPKNKTDPCNDRHRSEYECDSQRNIMLFLESIRQVVANKKGLSDLADLLLQCTCTSGSNGGGDNKSGLVSIFKIILEKIKACADDRSPMKKQMDLCGLVRTLTELQNNGKSARKLGAETCSCGSESSHRSLQASENISCLVKKILELGVKYCSNRNISLRNMLCKVLNDDVCNEELTSICRTICQYLESDRNVICDHVRKETSGRMVNAPCLPAVRGNIKYPTNMDCGSTSFSIPLPNECEDEGGVDKYRRKDKQRECCIQIDGPDIDNAMQGVNRKLPDGIEICRKGTMDLDSDVFTLKMGKKGATSDKKGLIEIELRTPKGPPGGRPQLSSIASQVDEDMLKIRVSSAGNDQEKGGKGKKGKNENGKGKGKGKGKKGKK